MKRRETKVIQLPVKFVGKLRIRRTVPTRHQNVALDVTKIMVISIFVFNPVIFDIISNILLFFCFIQKTFVTLMIVQS